MARRTRTTGFRWAMIVSSTLQLAEIELFEADTEAAAAEMLTASVDIFLYPMPADAT